MAYGLKRSKTSQNNSRLDHLLDAANFFRVYQYFLYFGLSSQKDVGAHDGAVWIEARHHSIDPPDPVDAILFRMDSRNRSDAPVDVLIVAVPETAGSALYGMFDVLLAAGNIWQTLVRSETEGKLFQVSIVSPEKGIFSCGNENSWRNRRRRDRMYYLWPRWSLFIF